jgi:hypothetical protein
MPLPNHPVPGDVWRGTSGVLYGINAQGNAKSLTTGTVFHTDYTYCHINSRGMLAWRILIAMNGDEFLETRESATTLPWYTDEGIGGTFIYRKMECHISRYEESGCWDYSVRIPSTHPWYAKNIEAISALDGVSSHYDEEYPLTYSHTIRGKFAIAVRFNSKLDLFCGIDYETEPNRKYRTREYAILSAKRVVDQANEIAERAGMKLRKPRVSVPLIEV